MYTLYIINIFWHIPPVDFFCIECFDTLLRASLKQSCLFIHVRAAVSFLLETKSLKPETAIASPFPKEQRGGEKERERGGAGWLPYLALMS